MAPLPWDMLSNIFAIKLAPLHHEFVAIIAIAEKTQYIHPDKEWYTYRFSYDNSTTPNSILVITPHKVSKMNYDNF